MAKKTVKPAANSTQNQPDPSAVSDSARPATTGEQPAQDANRPAHTIRYRNVKVSIWQNESNNGPFYSVTASRSWQDDKSQWHDSQSFKAGDLPTLAKAINDAHTWIAWTERRSKQPSQA
ncbi:MAG: hypothetical protein QM770_14515 [Tepidisphaeraceae bacterium]